MDGKYYSSERSVQLLISLLKQHGIKKIVASPGTTNLSFVASLQQDEWFEVYSSVDERSAAYLACADRPHGSDSWMRNCKPAVFCCKTSLCLIEASCKAGTAWQSTD